ncbi:hypothetical protein [Streptomyces sp. NPDC054783]
MTTHPSLAGRTVLMSGGSRGVGLAIALRAARDGANTTLIAKTDKPDPRLPGTIHTAAAEIEKAGGTALPIVGDIRIDATTDSRFTSMGMTAIDRFLRPITYQGFPDALLPEALQHANPHHMWRLVDGQLAVDS